MIPKDLTTFELQLGDLFISPKGLVKFIRVTQKGYNLLILEDNVTLMDRRHIYMHKDKPNHFWVHKNWVTTTLNNKIDKRNYVFILRRFIFKLSGWITIENDGSKINYRKGINVYNKTFVELLKIVDLLNKELDLKIEFQEV